jgi:hypothetical protein
MEQTAKLAAFIATCFCVISIGLCHWTMHHYDTKKRLIPNAPEQTRQNSTHVIRL